MPREVVEEMPKYDGLHRVSQALTSPSYSSYQPHRSYMSEGGPAHHYQTYTASGVHAHGGKHSALPTKRFIMRDGLRIPIDEYTGPDEKAITGMLKRVPTKGFVVGDGRRISMDKHASL